MDTKLEPTGTTDSELKTCCAAVYQSDWAKLILGDSFHPGGLALTERLGNLLDLKPGKRLLDVAAGQGASAIFLAQTYGCEVVGVDYGGDAARKATEAAAAAGIGHLARFEQGDAEHLSAADESFDAIICECAFCLFPEKLTAAGEFARVLRPGGRVGLSDLTRAGETPENLQGLLAWIACVAAAQPLDRYTHYLQSAGLMVDLIEPHHEALVQMAREIRARLLGAELLVKLKKIDLPPVDFAQAKTLARAASDAIQAHIFGYTLITATKPG